MANLILNGKKISGACLNGVNYNDLDRPSPQTSIVPSSSGTVVKSATTSLGTSYTSGYAITLTFKSDPFSLYRYKDFITPLSSLSSYKFLLYSYGTVKEITTLTVINDGNNLFHLEGTLDSTGLYSSAKLMPTDIQLWLVDENNDLLYSDVSSILSLSVNNTSVTTSFTAGTLTVENIDNLFAGEPISIDLPYDLITAPETNLETPPTRYGMRNVSSIVTFSTVYNLQLS